MLSIFYIMQANKISRVDNLYNYGKFYEKLRILILSFVFAIAAIIIHSPLNAHALIIYNGNGNVHNNNIDSKHSNNSPIAVDSTNANNSNTNSSVDSVVGAGSSNVAGVGAADSYHSVDDFKSTWRNTSKTVLGSNKFIAKHTKGSILNLDVGLGGGVLFNGDVWATASSIPTSVGTTPLTNSTIGNAFVTLGVTRWGKEDALYLSTLVSIGFGAMNATGAAEITSATTEAYKTTFVSGNIGINQRIGYTVDLSSNITITPYFALGGGICAGDYCSDYGQPYNELSTSISGTITGYLSQAVGMLLAYHTQRGQYIGLFTQIGLSEIWQTGTYAGTPSSGGYGSTQSGSDFLTGLSVNAGLQVGF